MWMLPLADRPRERLASHGSGALSTAELIAIVLGSGLPGQPVLELAREVLSRFGSLEALADASIEELCEVRGVGRAKAIALQAAFALGRRAGRPPSKRRLNNAGEVYAFIRDDLLLLKEERMLVLCLDTKSQPIRKEVVSIGTLSEVMAHPREVFHPAVRYKAAAIVVAHNHPSGDPTPSPEDYVLTRMLVEAGNTLQIPLYDHLIVAAGGYSSMRSRLGWR